MFNYPNYNQQPQFQTAQQQQYQPVFVHGLAGAQNHPVGPGQKVMLFDDTEDVLYVKQADQNGYVLPIETYDLVRREPAPDKQYVTKSELEEILDKKLEEFTR